MGILDAIYSRKSGRLPVYDDAYWKKRYEEVFKDKEIVLAFMVCFGKGHYNDFCGVKEIRGYYGKTYPPMDYNKSAEENFEKNVDVFYQIYPPSGNLEQWIHCIDHVFINIESAQEFYDQNVHLYTEPLQNRINALNSARSKEN